MQGRDAADNKLCPNMVARSYALTVDGIEMNGPGRAMSTCVLLTCFCSIREMVIQTTDKTANESLLTQDGYVLFYASLVDGQPWCSVSSRRQQFSHWF